MADVLYRVDVDWNADGDFKDAYEDITADVRGLSFDRGKNRELGFADPGTLSVRLTDSTNKYSPENAASVLNIPTQKLLPKRAVQVRAAPSSAWLGTWAHRIKLTLDSGDISATLPNFPTRVYLSTSSGRTSADVSAVFDELGADANRKKIAVTTSDGKTQCYVEIEKWDDANEKANLWVKVPSAASGADTVLYLYYDASRADNATYVGDTNSAPAENVWDANFLLVCHMRDDPDASHVRDSTGNDIDLTKAGAGAPAVNTNGKIADAQLFDGVNDRIQHPTFLDVLPVSDELTWEAWVKPTGGTGATRTILEKYNIAPFSDRINLEIRNTEKVRFWTEGGNLGVKMVESAVLAPSTNTFFKLTGIYVAGARLSVYVNKTKSLDEIADTVLDGTAGDFSIGEHSSGALDFTGVIDEIRVSDVDRGDAWVNASYESEIDDLIAYGSEESLLPLFYGYLEDIRPHPHLAEQSAFLYAIDGLDFLARHELGTVLYKNELTGTLVGHILTSAGWDGALRAIDAGQDTVPYAYWKDVMARFALQELEESEMAFLYVDGAGKLVYEDRHHRYSATHQTSQATFTDTMAQIVYDLGVASVRNEVRATVTPWTLQGIAELWRLQEVPSISAGDTKTWWGDSASFVDAWTTPVITTDYLANTQADGLGADKSAALGIITTKFAKAIKLQVTNNDANTVYITLLKARGTAYDDQTKVSRKSEDATSQGLYQKRTLELDGKFLTDAEKAQDFCDYGIARFKDPQPEVKMIVVSKTAALLTQILTRQLSDRITVQNTRLGLDKDFFINRMEHEIPEGGKLHICTFYLVDAENEDFWCLDYSELDIGTKLGY